MSKETRIIMSGDHPLKILNGTKTKTRRTAGLSIINDPPQRDSGWQLVAVFQDGYARFATSTGGDITLQCPYGGYGDILRVRETWATENQYNHLKPSEIPPTARLWYLADEGYNPQTMGKIRPSIFMPRWASRLTLEITEVRVQRLQEITEEDCKAEGIEYATVLVDIVTMRALENSTRIPAFKELWDSINGKKYPWNSNPWVWALRFEVMK